MSYCKNCGFIKRFAFATKVSSFFDGLPNYNEIIVVVVQIHGSQPGPLPLFSQLVFFMREIESKRLFKITYH